MTIPENTKIKNKLPNPKTHHQKPNEKQHKLRKGLPEWTRSRNNKKH